MSHVPLFFLYAVLIYLTIQVHKQPKLSRFMLIGLTAGHDHHYSPYRYSVFAYTSSVPGYQQGILEAQDAVY